jgi:hypothetical protein
MANSETSPLFTIPKLRIIMARLCYYEFSQRLCKKQLEDARTFLRVYYSMTFAPKTMKYCSCNKKVHVCLWFPQRKCFRNRLKKILFCFIILNKYN